MGVLAKAAGSLWDWIEAGYPEEVAKRIVSGELPMDEASRLRRAREQGYGDTLYVGHSSHAPIKSGTDLTLYSSKDEARRSADLDIESEELGLFDHLADEDDYFFDAPESPGLATVTPVRHNADQLLTHNAGGKSFGRVRETDLNYDELHHYPNRDYVKSGGMISKAVKRKQHPDNRLLPQYETVPPRQGVLYQDVKNYGGDIHNQTDLFGLHKQNSTIPGADVRHPDAAYDPQYKGSNIMGNATVPALGVLATGTGAALAAPALKSEGLEKATGFLDETIRSARHAAGPLSFLVPYEGISNFAKKWNADEDLTWQDYLGLLDF